MKEFIRIASLTSCVLGLFAAGVGDGDAAIRDQLDKESALATTAIDAESMSHCQFGYYECPDDAETFTYANGLGCMDECFSYGAEYPSVAQAGNACNSYCTAACINRGYQGFCEH